MILRVLSHPADKTGSVCEKDNTSKSTLDKHRIILALEAFVLYHIYIINTFLLCIAQLGCFFCA